VPPAAHCNQQVVIPTKIDRRHHIGCIYTASDEGRVFINHSIVNLAHFVVACLAWPDQIPAQTRLESSYRRLIRTTGGHICFDYFLNHPAPPAIDFFVLDVNSNILTSNPTKFICKGFI
jgi:hypothetical protein